MKSQVRVLGVDDSPFSFDDERVSVVGALIRLPSYLEAVMMTECSVDGDDATDALAEMIIRSRYREQMKAVIVDGIALGGFNIVDLHRLHARTGVPCISVTRDRPDMEAISNALRAHFEDWERRLDIIRRSQLYEVGTGHKPLHMTVVGASPEEASLLVQASTVRGVIPEPVRVAHLIATALVEGESRGRP